VPERGMRGPTEPNKKSLTKSEKPHKIIMQFH
jgi:hypothetical protein